MELGDRKQKILTAIIDSYIQTGEPVGSKALVEMLGNAVSSATIRNEMAELASWGYLEQPHTSAGRIPTAKAFRLYIDHLMRRQALSDEDQKDIDDMLAGSAGDPERLIGEASQALAESTGCAAVSTTPSEQGAVIRRIEIMRVSPRSAALLLMTGSGVLRSRVCRFDGDVDTDTLQMLCNVLTENFLGAQLTDIGVPQVQNLLISLGDYGAGLRGGADRVLRAGAGIGRGGGAAHRAAQPAAASRLRDGTARSLLGFLAQREQLMNMLAAHQGGLRVVLGSESLRPELNGSSIIVTRYSLDGRADGSIGLIGPLRMDYAATIPRLEYIAKAVGRLLSDMFGGEPPRKD